MAPGTKPADASNSHGPSRLRIDIHLCKRLDGNAQQTSDAEDGAEGQDQQGSPRHQARRHHRVQDDHLHPVPHIAQADGDCGGRGIYST